MIVRVAQIRPEEFETGLRCANCDDLLIQEWGIRADDRPIYMRRGKAVAAPAGKERIAWVWTLICANCV